MFVVLVRHAEPATGGTDPGLSQGGARRATRLAKMLADAGITDIFTSDLRRTRETAQPLASLSSITPVVIASNPAAAAAQIRAAGKRVLVVGHTNTVPLIIKALGGHAIIRWHEMTIVQDADGNPDFHLTGGMAEHVRLLGIDRVHLSMSHDAGIASAFVVLESDRSAG